MTVSAAVRKVGPTPGNSVATVFPFAFKVFVKTDLKVELTVLATGVVTTLVLDDPLGYSVVLNADQNANPGGSVTYNPAGVPLPATQALTISSIVPQAQGTHITNGGAFFANNVEDAVDKAVINVQDQAVKIAASVQIPSADSAGLNVTLPPAAQRANLVLGFDALGNVIATSGGSNIPISAAMTPVVQAATTALGRAALGISAAADAVITAATTALMRTALGIAAALNTVIAGAVGLKGSLLAGQGAAYAELAVGADGTALIADSTQASGLKYVTLGAGSVRQSVQSGVQDANGYANFLTTGAGLRPGLSATAKALVIAFAAGFGQAGAQDLVSTISADVADPLGADLPTSNTSYIHASYTSPQAVNYAAALVPPQYGFAFAQGDNTMLHFEESPPLCDFGNTYTITGAVVDATKPAYNAKSLNCSGGAGTNANTKRVETTSIVSVGSGSWEAAAVVWFDVQPNAGVTHAVCHLSNAAGFGPQFGWAEDGAGHRRAYWATGSSDGTTSNIFGTSFGVTNLTTGVWYRFRLTFDALAGTYKLRVAAGGSAAAPVWGAEVEELTVASTARICALTKVVWGCINNAGTPQNGISGFIDEAYILRAATKTATEVPAGYPKSVASFPVHFFSIPDMKMYEVTAASVAAGTNPTLTARNRVFLGEADTSGGAVTAVRSYALRGMYDAESSVLTSGQNFNHNLGVPKYRTDAAYFVVGTDTYNTGMEVPLYAIGANASGNTRIAGLYPNGRNSMAFRRNTAFAYYDNAGSATNATETRWKMRVSARREW